MSIIKLGLEFNDFIISCSDAIYNWNVRSTVQKCKEEMFFSAQTLWISNELFYSTTETVRSSDVLKLRICMGEGNKISRLLRTSKFS